MTISYYIDIVSYETGARVSSVSLGRARNDAEVIAEIDRVIQKIHEVCYDEWLKSRSVVQEGQDIAKLDVRVNALDNWGTLLASIPINDNGVSPRYRHDITVNQSS